jgi:hypothetical protein
MPELPRADEAHMVPSGYWKIVAVRDGATAKMAAFYFDQDTPRNSDYCDHLTTVDDIEMRSGLDFFHDLTGPVQDSLEAAPAALTKACAVRWGGDWRSFRDVAHVQLFPNTQLAQVKRDSGLA